ncbi:MAG: hypothetical protein MJ252_11970 [archaeon]|nr:hypothetical protein [archaeon]
MNPLSGKKNCHFLFNSLDKLKFNEPKPKYLSTLPSENKFKAPKKEEKPNTMLISFNSKVINEYFNKKKIPLIPGYTSNLTQPNIKNKSKNKNQSKTKERFNSGTKPIKPLNIQNKTNTHQIVHNKTLSNIITLKKHSNIVFNQVKSFKNISKNNSITNNKKNITHNQPSSGSNNSNSNCSSSYSLHSLQSKDKPFKKTNSSSHLSLQTQKSFKTETSTTASKRNKDTKVSSKKNNKKTGVYKTENVSINSNPSSSNTETIDENKQSIETLNKNYFKEHKFLESMQNKNKKIGYDIKERLLKNFSVKSKALKLKNNSMIYNKKYIIDQSASLISEESAFNNEGSLKHSTKNSNTNSFKSKSIDLTYSDDEIMSNRKKSEELLAKITNQKPSIMSYMHKDPKKEQINFKEFCDEINKKLFGDLSKEDY